MNPTMILSVRRPARPRAYFARSCTVSGRHKAQHPMLLDNQERTRRASQPFLKPFFSNAAPLLRSTSFLVHGVRAWRLPAKQTTGDALRFPDRRKSSTSSTRRITANSSDEENLIDELSCPTKQRGRGNVHDDHSAPDNWTQTSVHLWKRLVPRPKPYVHHDVAVMYSISFYPWKMEPHCYYSHPEAAANWVPDTASARCQICLVAFTLTRRRHHCRLCGHLVCATCSHDRTYLPFAGSAPSQHRLIKDGAPQRTCGACASTLCNMAGQDDPRVKRFTVAVSSKGRQKATESVATLVEVEIERPSVWMRRTGVGLIDDDMEEEALVLESTTSLQLESPFRGKRLQFPLRLSVTRAEELDEILSARACSRVDSSLNPNEEDGRSHFVMSSTWLNQWLQYVRMDFSAANAIPPRSKRGARSSKTYRPCRPGPVTNYALLDFVNGELVPKQRLRQSRGSHRKGDYRVVSQKVWVTFLEIYGGGPSIQVPIQDRGTHLPLVAETKGARPQWIITELDDAVPALASSPSAPIIETPFHQTEPTVLPSCSSRLMLGTRSASARCLLSVPPIDTHLSNQCYLPSEFRRASASSSWKVEEETAQARSNHDTPLDAATFSYRGDSCGFAETTSTLAVVSAFASAATLARKRSAASLSQHSAAISGRTNGLKISARA